MLLGYLGAHRNLCKAMNGLLYVYYNAGLAKIYSKIDVLTHIDVLVYS